MKPSTPIRPAPRARSAKPSRPGITPVPRPEAKKVPVARADAKPAPVACPVAKQAAQAAGVQKILIVDDHPVFRRGLREMLGDAFPGVKLGEAGDCAQALDVIMNQTWDMVVLDLNLPGRGGLDLLKEIRQARPKLPVLVLSMCPEDQMGVRVLQRGAAGYLTKDAPREEVVAAVNRVVAGHRYIPPSLADQLALHVNLDAQRPLHEILSDREYQVMCMIASGETVKEISNSLSLSVKTISTYRARILEKMSLKNNSEIMRYAYDHALLNG